MKIITDESCLCYHQAGHPERPQRIRGTLEKLRNQSELTLHWLKPLAVDESILLRAHTPGHLKRLCQPVDLDADTPAHTHIFDLTRKSVGAALCAVRCAQKGAHAFSLMRPPGHHAERERAMGFCYLNQIAIACLEALAQGSKKVAVYDFDVHHGNGTENILLHHPGCTFFSIHQDPCYPGTGTKSIGNCHNYPVPPGADRKNYRATLSLALKELQRGKPDLIGVSAGFDAYRGDPLSQETLELEDFNWIGETLRKLDIPCFCVLEGGYSNALPELILAFLKGLS